MSEPRRLRGSPTVLHVPSGRPCPPDMFNWQQSDSLRISLHGILTGHYDEAGAKSHSSTSVCGPGRTSCRLVPVTDLQLSADPTSLRPARDKTAACSIGSIWVAARKLWASTGDGVICRINLKCVYMFEEASRPRVKEHFGHVSTSMSHTPTPITKVASRILLEPGSQHIVRKHAHSCGTGSGHNPMAK